MFKMFEMDEFEFELIFSSNFEPYELIKNRDVREFVKSENPSLR